jgi:hypothetical protein
MMHLRSRPAFGRRWKVSTASGAANESSEIVHVPASDSQMHFQRQTKANLPLKSEYRLPAGHWEIEDRSGSLTRLGYLSRREKGFLHPRRVLAFLEKNRCDDEDYKCQGVAWIKTQQRSFRQLHCEVGCFGTEPVALVREVRPTCGGQRRHEGRDCPVAPDAGDHQAAPGGVALPGAQLDRYSRRVGDLPAVPFVTEAFEGVVHAWSASENCTTSAAATGRPWPSSDAYWNATMP